MTEVPFWIGRFVMQWNAQEQLFAWLVADLESGHREDIIRSVLISPTGEYEKRLIRARENIAHNHDGQPWIDKVLGLHKSLREVRHDVIHGWWSSMNREGDYLLQRTTKSQPVVKRPFTSEQLFTHTEEVCVLNLTIMDTRDVIRGRRPKATVS